MLNSRDSSCRLWTTWSSDCRLILGKRVRGLVMLYWAWLRGAYRAGSNQSDQFPFLPGSHLALQHPVGTPTPWSPWSPCNQLLCCSQALEFVKFVCHVLELDETVRQEVLLLKSNLLKRIKVTRQMPVRSLAVSPQSLPLLLCVVADTVLCA